MSAIVKDHLEKQQQSAIQIKQSLLILTWNQIMNEIVMRLKMIRHWQSLTMTKISPIQNVHRVTATVPIVVCAFLPQR